MEASNIIFGRNAVLEALNSGLKINKIWHDAKPNPKILEIINIAKEKKIPIHKVEKKKLYELTGTNDHRSIAAQLSPVDFIED